MLAHRRRRRGSFASRRERVVGFKVDPRIVSSERTRAPALDGCVSTGFVALDGGVGGLDSFGRAVRCCCRALPVPCHPLADNAPP